MIMNYKTALIGAASAALAFAPGAEAQWNKGLDPFSVPGREGPNTYLTDGFSRPYPGIGLGKTAPEADAGESRISGEVSIGGASLYKPGMNLRLEEKRSPVAEISRQVKIRDIFGEGTGGTDLSLFGWGVQPKRTRAYGKGGISGFSEVDYGLRLDRRLGENLAVRATAQRWEFDGSFGPRAGQNYAGAGIGWKYGILEGGMDYMHRFGGRGDVTPGDFWLFNFTTAPLTHESIGGRTRLSLWPVSVTLPVVHDYPARGMDGLISVYAGPRLKLGLGRNTDLFLEGGATVKLTDRDPTGALGNGGFIRGGLTLRFPLYK